jgi:thermostable 8-oxoguanine DNA glycosylase
MLGVMCNTMTDIQLYQSAYNFLLRFPGITESDLKQHLTVHSANNKPTDINLIYKQLCQTAQNKQMSPKVIGESIGGFSNLGVVLYNFNPFNVAENYLISDHQKLLQEIISVLRPKGQVRLTLKSEWPKYCATVLEAAYFIKDFETSINFYNWADKFCKDIKSKYGLPLLITTEVKGIGFPLACDFLKEIGYKEYGKPDVHVKDIFFDLNIVDGTISSTLRKDYLTAKAIDRIALANNVTPFAVDKIFWLLGSGNFHVTGQNIGSQKKAFVASLQ